MSSAIRKIPVSGACMTPAINPDIPAKAKLASGTPKPIIFIKRAQTKPVIAPIKSEGAKIPPTPPPPLVATDAKILNSRMAAKYPTKTHELVPNTSKGLLAMADTESPLMSCLMTSYPSPYSGGKRNNRIPKLTPPTRNFAQVFCILRLKSCSNVFIPRVK